MLISEHKKNPSVNRGLILKMIELVGGVVEVTKSKKMKSIEENANRIRKMISELYWLAVVAFFIWIIKLVVGF